MVKFNSDLSLYGPSSFTLLYPDRTEVKYLPGGTEPFALQRYKEELGKSFNRITLYLCKTTAILDAMFLKKYSSDESDVDLPNYHLKQYICSLQGKSLSLFLQFITGSDIVSCESIEVTFSVFEGMSRRPVAHTCGPLLEIPSSYQSYNELSEEFSELLQNKEAWHFKIA